MHLRDFCYCLTIRIAPVLLASSIATACSAIGDRAADTSTTPATQADGSSSSFGSQILQLLSGTPSKPTADSPEPSTSIHCPPVDVRSGASTLSVTAPTVDASTDSSAMSLRYQGTFAHFARECALVESNLKIKVGVQGRIILGPTGGPGQFEIPLRIAMVREGPEPKTVWTKFYKLPIVIPEGQAYVNFTQIEDDLTVPKPNAADLEAYVIYVGFDPLGLQPEPKKRPPSRKKR